MPGDCSFNTVWLHNDRYKDWLVQDKLLPSSNARCKICLKSFDIRSMGESALKSHRNGKKHQERMNEVKTYDSVSVKNKTKLLTPILTSASDQRPEAEAGNAGESSNSVQSTSSLVRSGACALMATKNDLLSAELLWARKICI